MRTFINELEKKGLLVRVKKEIDPRNLASLISQSINPIIFEKIKNYKQYSVVSGLFCNRETLANVLSCSTRNIAQNFECAIENSIKPIIVKETPAKEIIKQDEELNLYDLPIPLLHVGDGGPFISGGVLITEDPLKEFGINLGFYRLMYRSKNITGIDIDRDSDLGRYYERALRMNKSLPISVVIGTHPAVMVAAAYKAPLGVSEYCIAGGIMKKPVNVTHGITNNILIPADSEIVLEGEIMPIGWEEQEGPFGEFAGFQSKSHWNPIVKFNCMLMRKDPIFYVLGMPWENIWLHAASTEALVLKAITNAGIKVHEVRSMLGGACLWYVVASIEKNEGEGKNAVMAALSAGSVKIVIITDDDVDIFNQYELDRAVTFRVRPHKDVIIIEGARAYHVDPTVAAWRLPKGVLPTTSKIGIDATIPEDIPKERYKESEIFRKEDVILKNYIQI